MMRLKRMAAVIALIVLSAAVAAAQISANQRTVFKFDAPVMVPGATLQPGSYVFRLLDSETNRHMVQILTGDGTRVITTTQAVPTKRQEATGDVVVKLNPTESGAPAAIKAWFYPGTVYGHEFVYSDEEARRIANRTKTLVLSTDVPGSDMEKGTLYTYDAEGRKTAWRGDDAVVREWNDWARRNTAAQGTARMQTPPPGSPEATAPAMRSNPQGMEVSIDQIEDDPARYTGKTISVTGEVDEVLGARVFKLDEPNWADLEGELLVSMPSNLAALVKEGDRVTVTGTMKALTRADLEHELGWLEPADGWDTDLVRNPVLVANRIVGGNSDVALAIDVSRAPASAERPVGTSGTTSAPSPLTDANAVSRGELTYVGRVVDFDNIKVSRVDGTHGFWIDAGGTAVFVLPAQHVQGRPSVAAGQSVSIDGLVLEMPRAMRERKNHPTGANDTIYIYATGVK